MTKTGFTVNVKDFDKKFKNIIKTVIPGLAEEGLFKGASELLLDADKEVPKTPKDKGDLRASKKVEKPKMTGKTISVAAGFDIEYAAPLHEMEKTKANRVNWSFPGSGPKFLESKMVRNKDKYIKIAAEVIKRGAK